MKTSEREREREKTIFMQLEENYIHCFSPKLNKVCVLCGLRFFFVETEHIILRIAVKWKLNSGLIL